LSAGKDALASSIAELRATSPSDARLSALAARLASAGAPVDDTDAPASTRVPKPGRLGLARLKNPVDSGLLAILLAVIVGAGVITAALVLRSEPEAVRGTPLPAAAPPVATATAPQSGALPAAAATASDGSVRAAPDRDHAAPAPAARDADTAPHGSATAASTSPASATAPHATPPNPPAPSESTAVARPLAPATKSSAPPARSATSRALSSAPSTAAEGALTAGAPVVSEVELLKQARSALVADPLQAFALTEQCRSRYPNGSFVQEREYIAIVALARLGRTDEARSRASLFRMHYKNSAYLPRLGALLGEP
jgi:hypothetical protein